jgi:dipeptidyl aminopeptidase/acylaminoacyl peptidase
MTAETVGAKRGFQPEDLLRQAQIQDLTVSPDGETVVYSRRIIADGKYRTHLWLVPWAGGEPRQLTFSEANDTAPLFSPDGCSLVFISDRGGRKQPWLLRLDGGEPRLAAEIAGEAKAARWSPDERRLLVIAPSGVERLRVGDPDDPIARVIDDFAWRLDASGFRDQLMSVWVAVIGGREPRRVTDPSWEVLDARWQADGQHLAVVADAEPDAGMRRLSERAAAWRIDVDVKREPRLLARLPGGIAAVRPAPDSGDVAVIGKDYDRQPSWADTHLYVGKGTDLRRLGADLDRPVENVTTGDLVVRGSRVACEWLDANTIIAQVGDAGRTLPYRFDVESGAASPLIGGEIVCNNIAVAGDRVVMVASDRGGATEVYALEEGEARALTENGSDWLQPFRRDPIRYQIDHPDGHRFDTWLIEGHDAPRPGPVVIQIHGGPHAAHGPTPWLEMLALADAGFHVLYPNPRGSSGYGEEFARAIHGHWGEVDGADHLRLVDWAIETGLADPERIGVMGLSGGGYMTLWLLGHHPGRFRAGLSENPVSNWVSWYGGSDLTAFTDERFAGIGRLPENIDAFLAASPFMAIHENRAPLLLLQAEGDLRCPPEQSETVFAILRSRGVPTQFVRYPGEPHFLAGIGRPDRRVDRLQRIVDWFRTHLGTTPVCSKAPETSAQP